mmetsp:Transcript_37765/g.87725  ORF Transcript_37765/g.87725 Transcript_37765/m.87725 type:complete len:278 (+) Transcript_37765:79-912(+)
MAQRNVDTVTFNVGGRHHEVLRLTIEAHPGTLLANLLDDIGSDSALPLFVDANPDRFAYILDWYRFGEMHLPTGYPTKAILNDARFYLLPDTIKINGSSHMFPHPLGDLHHAAVESVTDAVVASVTRDWPTFEEYVTQLIAAVQSEAEAAGARAKEVESLTIHQGEVESLRDQLIFCKEICLMDAGDWFDEANVCSMLRLKVLVAELKKRGLHCEFTPFPDCYRRLPAVTLTVGLGQECGAQRIRIGGVKVSMGRLQVCSHHCGHNTDGECWLCAVP